MSKTFSVATPMTVSTMTSAGRMLGMVTNRNIPMALTPSRRAASTMSSGIALIAADRIVIAKPAWIQIMMMIRKIVLYGLLSSHCCGVPPTRTTSSLSRPICLMPCWSGRNS